MRPTNTLLFIGLLTSTLIHGDNNNNNNSHCPRIPNPTKKDLFSTNYNSTTETLSVDLTDLLHKFCEDTIYNVTSLRIDLLKKKGKTCKEQANTVQSTQHLSPADPTTTFQYAQGRYFLRLLTCDDNDSSCVVAACTQALQLSSASNGRDDDTCRQGLDNITDGVVQTVHEEDSCSVSVQVTVPLCTSVQPYNVATIFTTEEDEEDAECGMDTFMGANHVGNVTVQECREQCDNNSNTHWGLIEHSLQNLQLNRTSCVYYQLDNPHCDPPCLFSHSVSCGKQKQQHVLQFLFLLPKPMFIGVVSLTLFLSLSLLMWTVIYCSRKRPETPTLQPIKKPPRSLTEDDLEHISRLPSQEIVLVYFPDTTRFKELNRRFRNWLITLDVNDVKDIYDEKCSEDVLKDPEKWVKDTLGGPEKRIILVCSRLAYECLVTVKKSIASPKFVETDPHFGLLTRAIQYLDREMRGNYRNLICVRYDDLKICDRQYSSDAFNIVPGTEYVLPQHLEDVYRWIHPKDPKPECWSESRQEVRELLDYMRKYRLHDDNIFTVHLTEVVITPVQEKIGGGKSVSFVQNCSSSSFSNVQDCSVQELQGSNANNVVHGCQCSNNAAQETSTLLGST